MLFRLFGLFLLFTTLSACTELPYTNINNDQLQTMLEQKVPIFDVRRPNEWQQTGVVEGSQLLTFVDSNGRVNADFLNRFSASVNKDEPVILICRTGNRTNALARLLVEQKGFTQVYNVRNGIKQWIKEERPIKYL